MVLDSTTTRRGLFFRDAPSWRLLCRGAAGIGGAHQHVALKGSREGSRTTRCTEAGVYARDFVDTVAEVLSQVLCGGGQAVEPQAGQNSGNKDEGNQFRGPGDQSRAAIDIIPDRAEQGRVVIPDWAEQGRAGSRDGYYKGYYDKEVVGVKTGCMVPWLDDIFDDEDYVSASGPVAGVVVRDAGSSAKAGGNGADCYRAPNQAAKEAAVSYITEVNEGKGGEPRAWDEVMRRGAALLDVAGSVERAAESLWQVREEQGLNNLAGTWTRSCTLIF